MGMKPRKTKAERESLAEAAREARDEQRRMLGAFDAVCMGPWMLEARIAPAFDSKKTITAARIGGCKFKVNRNGTKTVTITLHYQDDGGKTL